MRFAIPTRNNVIQPKSKQIIMVYNLQYFCGKRNTKYFSNFVSVAIPNIFLFKLPTAPSVINFCQEINFIYPRVIIMSYVSINK